MSATGHVRVVRFYQSSRSPPSCLPPSPPPSPPPRKLQSSVGTAGIHLPGPDCSGHCRTSAATARSQGALPDIICQLQIPVGTADPSGHCRASVATARFEWALPDFSRDCQIPVGTTTTARSQWALPDFSRELKMPVGTAGLQLPAPDFKKNAK
eukprot:s2627_g2.t1